MRSQRGRGRGAGSASTGPALPFKIRQELDLQQAGGSRTPKQRGSMFRVSQRKEQRKAARQKGRGAVPQLSRERGRGLGAPQRTQKTNEVPGRSQPEDRAAAVEDRPAMKRPAARPAERAPASKKTRFQELLGADAVQVSNSECCTRACPSILSMPMPCWESACVPIEGA
jgi:hypothetical protein